MSESTFTIEFPEHLPREKWQYVLDQLATDTGASIEQLGGRNFLLVCTRPSEVQRVGWALFHTHFNTKCKVVSVSGAAIAQAGAYQNPPKSRHSK